MKARAGIRACRLAFPASHIVSVPSSLALRVSSSASALCSQCLDNHHHNHITITARQYHPSRRKNQSALASAVSAAQNLFSSKDISKSHPSPPLPSHPTTPPRESGSLPSNVSIDPLRLVAKELKFLKKNLRYLLGSGHPILDQVAKYYAQSEGKQVRPMLVLLMSQATALTTRCPRREERERLLTSLLTSSPSSAASGSYINDSINSPAILADTNPDLMPLSAPSRDEIVYAPSKQNPADNFSNVLPTQRRLAEITELIHTASLLHDDVIDNAITRRSNASANLAFGNKMAVLAGDFLLGRASVFIARLRDPEVIELLGTVMANLVEGEFMQLKNTMHDEANPVWTEDIITYYLQKTYLKSASLISKSCRAAALLNQSDSQVVEAAYLYGRNLGLAFQLVDDMLDYTISGAELGKPAGADLELGLATSPLLFAWKEYPELGKLVGRKFSHEGDVQLARELVARSDGLEQTRALAQEYADNAIAAISKFPDSEAKDGLIDMCTKTMTRRK